MISLQIAKRELRNNLRYWSVLTLNLLIGLIGFTFIILFRENVNSALSERSKQMLTSDMAITGRRALADKEKELVAKYLADKTAEQSLLTEVYSMAKVVRGTEKRSRLTLIKAFTGNYPLIGNISFERGDQQLSLDPEVIAEFNQNAYVLISPEVAHQFKLKVGELIQFGEKEFEVYGVIKKDSTTSMRGMNLAPKVYIAEKFLKSTALISFGTVAWYTQFYALKETAQLAEVKTGVEKLIIDPAIKVRTPENSSEQLSRTINYLSDYLGLIGIVALLISSVGSSFLFQSYLFERIKTIGIMKSVGVSRNQIFLSFVYLIFFVGFVATCLTLALANIFMPIALGYVKEWFVGNFVTHLDLELFGMILFISVVLNFVISIPILIRIFKHKTIHLLSGKVVERVTLKEGIYYIPGVLLLWGLSVWQSHSLKIGSIFCLSILAIFAFVLTVFPVLFKIIDKRIIGNKVSFPYGLEFGYAIRGLMRDKVTTILTLLSLVIGVTLLSVVGQLEFALRSELKTTGGEKPSLFLFDIQDDQYADLVQYAEAHKIPLRNPTPMIRGRLLKKNGEKVKRKAQADGFSTREADTARRFNNRGVNLTYAAELNSAEVLEEGKLFSGKYSGEGLVEISLEKRYARRLDVGVGDTVTYEVMGVEVQGKIVNLRHVKWTSFLPNFFITIQPGVLEEAPKTFLAVVDHVDFERQLEIQDLLVEKFSNVSMLSVSTIIERITVLFRAMSWAIGVMSLCCIVVGLFVLFSILRNQIRKKQKEIALQKIMGFSDQRVFKIILIEYLIIIFITICCGMGIGTGLSYVLSIIFLDGLFIFNGSFFTMLNTSLVAMMTLIIYFTYKTQFRRKINDLLLN